MSFSLSDTYRDDYYNNSSEGPASHYEGSDSGLYSDWEAPVKPEKTPPVRPIRPMGVVVPYRSWRLDQGTGGFTTPETSDDESEPEAEKGEKTPPPLEEQIQPVAQVAADIENEVDRDVFLKWTAVASEYESDDSEKIEVVPPITPPPVMMSDESLAAGLHEFELASMHAIRSAQLEAKNDD